MKANIPKTVNDFFFSQFQPILMKTEHLTKLGRVVPNSVLISRKLIPLQIYSNKITLLQNTHLKSIHRVLPAISDF